ncbi:MULTISPECIES: NAD(P)/FAD-dependent oxidoreductase [unclassified Wenzhouxiangella]|uniref:NAD(P)/FAD-dependent oxidoreductase n=1 Tax=unclassified Wenzhouxiangella TaxID=2613841 RepID=UPI000E327E4B|nr:MULTISPECIES: FAD-dependent oxidoreductase [unclassified Wenzhouxiangella]RFF28663.1 FAD-dependent oxidoreductase [Wenzhouxiangella sp. 15181]RFP70280.1 FAD-dependent oxidoreductase [Wenzhouxiangella sp. 15190]
MIDVIVIGAGWSGLTAAARLASSGRSVAVVEKSRGPGGRSATRREEGFIFDHGAQYLTARSDAFSRQVEAWTGAGLLAPWTPSLTVFGKRPDHAGESPARRWVGVGGMNAVLHRLAGGLDCRWGWRAESIEFDRQSWRVRSTDGQLLEACSLLVTAPPAQSSALLGPEHAFSGQLDTVEMLPCWSVMVGFAEPPATAFDAAFVNEGPLSWVARNDSKPGSQSTSAWIGHASAAWSRDNLEAEPEEVADALFAAMTELDSAFNRPSRLCLAHRWRYAMARAPLDGPILADDGRKLVVAGDWCAGERIEGAWISGVAAAQRLASVL